MTTLVKKFLTVFGKCQKTSGGLLLFDLPCTLNGIERHSFNSMYNGNAPIPIYVFASKSALGFASPEPSISIYIQSTSCSVWQSLIGEIQTESETDVNSPRFLAFVSTNSCVNSCVLVIKKLGADLYIAKA